MHSSKKIVYIAVATKCSKKWVEVKVVRTYTATNDAENIISRLVVHIYWLVIGDRIS